MLEWYKCIYYIPSQDPCTYTHTHIYNTHTRTLPAAFGTHALQASGHLCVYVYVYVFVSVFISVWWYWCCAENNMVVIEPTNTHTHTYLSVIILAPPALEEAAVPVYMCDVCIYILYVLKGRIDELVMLSWERSIHAPKNEYTYTYTHVYSPLEPAIRVAVSHPPTALPHIQVSPALDPVRIHRGLVDHALHLCVRVCVCVCCVICVSLRSW